MSCPVLHTRPCAPPATPPPGALPPGILPALSLARGQTGRLLAGLLPWLAGGRRAYCLDGGNCFNPYALTTQARAAGLDPAPLLERLFVSRAYTCHQLLEATATMLAPLAGPPDPPLALILGIDALFLEDEIGLEERRRIFGRLVARAHDLARRGLPLVITVLNAECGMRSAELKQFYTPFSLEARTPPSAIECGMRNAVSKSHWDFSLGMDELPVASCQLPVNDSPLIPHFAFRIPHLEA